MRVTLTIVSNMAPTFVTACTALPPEGANFSRGGPSKNFIYLASQSPRRRQLLEQLGVAYQLLLPDAGEDDEWIEAVIGSEPPAAYVKRVTALKLATALQRRKHRGTRRRG